MPKMTGILAPTSTYRVQFRPGFGFHEGAELADYLSALGIGALYASPHFQSGPGSTHGYDVVDPSKLNEELGGEAGYQKLHEALQRHQLGLIADIVPNHMGIANGQNHYWQDVLENGRTSRYAAFFDIDWDPLKEELRGKVLLPVLGEQYGVVLEQGELKLSYEDGGFSIHYYELPLPIAPPTYATILHRSLERIEQLYEPDELPRLEFLSVLSAFEQLAPNATTDPEMIDVRQREQQITRRRLDTLVSASPELAQAIDQSIAELNGVRGDPSSFDALDALLEAQSYRLAFWRVASDEINYRRFFAINELAAVRQEVPQVFNETHQLLMRLIAEGKITGVRIDHPDGLWNPGEYFHDLQRAAYVARATSEDDGRSAVDLALEWDAQWEDGGKDTAPCSLYVTIEKILEPGEDIPDEWPVSGTVGYEFARIVTGLFVDPTGQKGFDQWYERFIDSDETFQETVYEAKRLILRVALSSELQVLALALNRLSERRRRTRDFTLNNLRLALREVIAAFPIYRTYLGEEGILAAHDRKTIEQAVQRARRQNPSTDPYVFNFVRDMLIGRDEATDPEDDLERIRFTMRFQQLTGPVMAKGLEDTAFYRNNRFVALNEVGGDPAQFGVPVAEFHRHNQHQLSHWPGGMLASSTHDTKRSEDVRARIATLSEYPRDWRAATNRWSKMNRKQRSRVAGLVVPTLRDEALFYQTLVGTWPFNGQQAESDFIDRTAAYMQKAAREAQLHTTWENPDADYEAALERFVRQSLDPAISTVFLEDFGAMHLEIARAGMITSLAMQLLKLTSPGVPDLYQGTELWDFSLVDPDNRRPVDFSIRRAMLAQIDASQTSTEEMLNRFESGLVKMFVTRRVLQLRQQLPDLFAGGDYIPLQVIGDRKDHVIAYARRQEETTLIVVVPRLVRRLMRGGDGKGIASGAWGSTRIRLPEGFGFGAAVDIFTGESWSAEPNGELFVADLLDQFPVACLMIDGSEQGSE